MKAFTGCEQPASGIEKLFDIFLCSSVKRVVVVLAIDIWRR